MFRIDRNDERGFTLIELLVVILIIGILAAIALPAFVRQKDQAYDADAKSNTSAAKSALHRVRLDKGDATNVSVGDLVSEDNSLAEANNQGRLFYIPMGADSYILAVQAKKTNDFFAYYKVDGQSAISMCAPATKGGCGKEIPGFSFGGIGPVGKW